MSRVTLIVVLVLLSWLAVQSVMAGGVTVDPMKFDRNNWGLRKLIVPIENVRDDTARIEIVMDMIYVDHYMSGLESITVDTSLFVSPKSSEIVNVLFELPGSFGRMNTRVTVRFRFDNQTPDEPPYDSAMQNFSNAFPARTDAEAYESIKHSIGPASAMLEHSLINFELPRLTLFLMSRGDTVEHIARLFNISREDVQVQIGRLRSWGLYPFTGADSLAPAIIAISEKEGYAIRGDLAALTDDFTTWYDGEGKPRLDAIAVEAGIDPALVPMHELRLALLYVLFMEPYQRTEGTCGVPTFENAARDRELFNHARFIIQGGDYFMPRVMLAAFARDSMLVLGTFRARPAQPFDKFVLVELNRDVESVFRMTSRNSAMVPVDWVRTFLTEARDNGVLDGFRSRFEQALNGVDGKLKTSRSYQRPYLADYLCRVMLGGYFKDIIDARQSTLIAIRY